MKASFLRVGVAAATVAILVGAIAGPVEASPTPVRTIPAGDAMFALASNNQSGLADDQLLSVGSSTGLSSAIGSPGVVRGSSAEQPAWDAATKTAFFIANPASLSSMNITTGAVTLGPRFNDGHGNNLSPQSIAITATGAGFAMVNSQLYTLDLGTASLTPLPQQASIGGLYALAFSTSGVLYGLNYLGYLVTLDTTTGLSTPVATLAFGSNTWALSMQVASDGIIWVTNQNSDNLMDLYSVDVTSTPNDPTAIAASVLSSGHLHTDTMNGYYTRALLLIPRVAVTFTSATSASPVVGIPFSFTVSADGNPTPTLSEFGTLPPGITFDASTGALSGTPTSIGTYSFIVTGTNIVGPVSETFTLTVVSGIHLPVVGG